MNSITIKDIAREANVSVATVSRALNQTPHVTTAMQERVFAAARRLGYVPNAAARTLKTNSTHTIGIMLADIANPDYMSIIRTIEDIVGRENYSIITCSTGDLRGRELDYLQMLYSKNIDGLIANTTQLNNSFLMKINQVVPTILLNRPINEEGFHGDFITTDCYQGIYLLTKHLLDLGHRRIYVIKGPPHLTNNFERFQGFVAAMAEAGVTVDDNYPYMHTGGFDQQAGIDAVQKFWTMDPRPTALISLNNMTMLGVLKELSRSPYRIQIPEELTLATYDSLPNIELMSIRPMTAQFDNDAIGVRSAHCILERIKDPSMPNRKFVFEPQIQSGNAAGIPRS